MTARVVGSVLHFAHDRAQRRRWLGQLCELVAIPSISAQPRHREDVARSAHWLAKHLRRIGLDAVDVIDTPVTGAASVVGQHIVSPSAPTILFYGHHDVQPTGIASAWHVHPFRPLVRDGYLFGRGASDDKGQLFAPLCAIESWMHTVGRLPINVKVWSDGEEEIGSPHFGAFAARHRRRLDADAAVICDSQMLAVNRPTVSYGQRGLVTAELRVRGSSHDVHDGLFGGATPNAAHALATIVAGLHDERGRVSLPGFYDDVRPIDERERAALRSVLLSDTDIAAKIGVPPAGEPGWSAAERIALRPAVNATGVSAGYGGPGGRSIVPSSAWARVNVRLVPDQRPADIARRLRDYVVASTPMPLHADVAVRAMANPVLLPRRHWLSDAACRAALGSFGRPPVFVRSGGTIPAVAGLREHFQMPVLLLGLGLPDDNIHAPNERFRLENFFGGVDTMIRLLAASAR